jgi:hypothetical protein
MRRLATRLARDRRTVLRVAGILLAGRSRTRHAEAHRRSEIEAGLRGDFAQPVHASRGGTVHDRRAIRVGLTTNRTTALDIELRLSVAHTRRACNHHVLSCQYERSV